MRRWQRGYTVADALGLILFLALAGSYLRNGYEIFHASRITGLVALRIIGIFVPPLGIILGVF